MARSLVVVLKHNVLLKRWKGSKEVLFRSLCWVSLPSILKHLFGSVAEGSLLFYEAGTHYSISRQLAAVLAPQIKVLQFNLLIFWLLAHNSLFHQCSVFFSGHKTRLANWKVSTFETEYVLNRLRKCFSLGGMLEISKDSFQYFQTYLNDIVKDRRRLVPRLLTYTCTKSDFRLPVTLQNLLYCKHVETHWPWIMFFTCVRVRFNCVLKKKSSVIKAKTIYGTSNTRSNQGRARSIALSDGHATVQLVE